MNRLEAALLVAAAVWTIAVQFNVRHLQFPDCNGGSGDTTQRPIVGVIELVTERLLVWKGRSKMPIRHEPLLDDHRCRLTSQRKTEQSFDSSSTEKHIFVQREDEDVGIPRKLRDGVRLRDCTGDRDELAQLRLD